MNSTSAYSPPLPRWFRRLLVVVATLMLCACSAPQSRMARFPMAESGGARPASGTLTHDVISQEMPPRAVMQASFVSQQFVENCPTVPYDGPMGPPCACCNHGGCDSCGPCGPVVGPPDEYICDGGDYGVEAGVRTDWAIEGLEQEDTIVHYDTLSGEVIVQPSNRVCIYAPRFGAVREVVNPMNADRNEKLVAILDEMAPSQSQLDQLAGTSLQRLAPIANLGDQPASLYRSREQAMALLTPVRVMEVIGMIAPYCDYQVIKLGIIDNAEKPWLAKQIDAAITWTGDQSAQVTIDGTAAAELIRDEQPGQMYHLDGPDSPKIRLIKLASTNTAHPGEEVSFTLRYDNTGDQQIGNVTIVDHLSVRLEYVPDSAQASSTADFSAEELGDGSTVLRWEIKDPVDVGKGGLLQFKAKVR